LSLFSLMLFHILLYSILYMHSFPTRRSSDLALQDLRLKLNGRLSLAQYKKASMSGTLTAKNIRQDSYRLGLLQGNFQLDQGGAQLQIKTSYHGEQLLASIVASHIWTQHTQLQIDI